MPRTGCSRIRSSRSLCVPRRDACLSSRLRIDVGGPALAGGDVLGLGAAGAALRGPAPLAPRALDQAGAAGRFGQAARLRSPRDATVSTTGTPAEGPRTAGRASTAFPAFRGLVHHVQTDDDGERKFKDLAQEQEPAADVRGIEHDDDDVRSRRSGDAPLQHVDGDPLVGRPPGERDDAGQIDDAERLSGARDERSLGSLDRDPG